MNRTEKTKTLGAAIAGREQCALMFEGEASSYYCFPLAMSERLLLCAEEIDFLADGFAVHKLFDVEDIEIMDDKYADILKSEGVGRGIVPPDMDISSWQTVFRALMNNHRLVMVETVDRDDGPIMGRVISLNDKMIGLSAFDRYGDRTDEIIPFDNVLCVAFDNRYLKIWEKYL